MYHWEGLSQQRGISVGSTGFCVQETVWRVFGRGISKVNRPNSRTKTKTGQQTKLNRTKAGKFVSSRKLSNCLAKLVVHNCVNQTAALQNGYMYSIR